MSILLVVLDGASDWPCKELGGKTPLEAAHMPELDRLARSGSSGTVRIADYAPESCEAVLSLLGFDPVRLRVRRGAFEAIGAGADFKSGDLALRANFATIEGRRIVDRRVGRTLTSREARALARTLNKIALRGAGAAFLPTVGHRGVLIIRRRGLSDAVSNTDPAYEALPVGAAAQPSYVAELRECVPLRNDLSSRLSAELVNEWSLKAIELLAGHPINAARVAKGLLPANCVLLRDAATKRPRLRSMRHWLFLADMPLEAGIAKAASAEVVVMPPALSEEAYKARAKAALRELGRSNVYVHLKGPDVAGHDGDARAKVQSLELIDRGFFRCCKGINLRRHVLAITCDHATPCALKAHSSDPVPLLVVGRGVASDGTTHFCERAARKGRLGRVSALRLLKFLQAVAQQRHVERH